MIRVGDQIPDFTLQGPDGAGVPIATYRGKRVILLALRGLW